MHFDSFRILRLQNCSHAVPPYRDEAEAAISFLHWYQYKVRKVSVCYI